jgi:hypothetical protein
MSGTNRSTGGSYSSGPKPRRSNGLLNRQTFIDRKKASEKFDASRLALNLGWSNLQRKGGGR